MRRGRQKLTLIFIGGGTTNRNFRPYSQKPRSTPTLFVTVRPYLFSSPHGALVGSSGGHGLALGESGGGVCVRLSGGGSGLERGGAATLAASWGPRSGARRERLWRPGGARIQSGGGGLTRHRSGAATVVAAWGPDPKRQRPCGAW
jgi:hypothetical protein